MARRGCSRAELAELALLEQYDRLRSRAGHDYGAGQRGAELIRRRRPFHAAGMDPVSLCATVEPAELEQAFTRVGRPRMRRLELEHYRHGTAATRRTLETWRRIARAYSGKEL